MKNKYKIPNLLSLTSHLLSRKGFTLVELIIYMGLLMMLTILMVDIFVASLNVQLESQATSAVEQDGRYLLGKLTYDLQNAQDILTPAAPGEQETYLQIVVDGINYSYALNNGVLQLTNNNGTDQLNSIDTTISNVSFQRLGNSLGKQSIRVSFTITSNIKRSNVVETKTFQTTVGLR